MNKDTVTKIISDEVFEKNTNTVAWCGNEITITTLLDAYTASSIVSNAVAGCFDAEGNYIPDGQDFLFRVLIVAAYTDIEMPDDNDVKYALVYGTDIFDVVVANVNSAQLGSIAKQIDDSVEYTKKMHTEAMTSKLIDLNSMINSIVADLGRIVGDVSAEDIQKLVSAISDSKFDEAKLAKAIVEEQTKE